MRQAIVDALRAHPPLQAVVDDRIYWRHGLYGGLSKQETPEAFDEQGDARPSVVVVKQERVRPVDKPKVDILVSVQRVAVWAFDGRGYDGVEEILYQVEKVLHRGQLMPVHDRVNWNMCLWASESGEDVDPDIRFPHKVAFYEVTVSRR